ncbi:MAG TPA: class I SAM-dependent methyltransferase, partial [Burkholderiaceae bacterium]
MQTGFNEEKLHALMGRALNDFGAVSQAPLVVIGDKLGLYKAMATAEGVTSATLAQATGTHERYVREWLNANAASGYIDYHPATGCYSMSAEQAMVFADDTSPAFLIGAWQSVLAAVKIADRLEQSFKTGAGIGWHEHDHALFCGIERFFKGGYAQNLVPVWIPALDGVQQKLEAGARVADIGCGLGASTILMAQAYPNSSFIGFDYHAGSIEQARL